MDLLGRVDYDRHSSCFAVYCRLPPVQQSAHGLAVQVEAATCERSVAPGETRLDRRTGHNGRVSAGEPPGCGVTRARIDRGGGCAPRRHRTVVRRDAYLGHRDHRVVGRAALDAVYPLARDRLAFPELEAEGLSP